MDTLHIRHSSSSLLLLLYLILHPGGFFSPSPASIITHSQCNPLVSSSTLRVIGFACCGERGLLSKGRGYEVEPAPLFIQLDEQIEMQPWINSSQTSYHWHTTASLFLKKKTFAQFLELFLKIQFIHLSRSWLFRDCWAEFSLCLFPGSFSLSLSNEFKMCIFSI